MNLHKFNNRELIAQAKVNRYPLALELAIRLEDCMECLRRSEEEQPGEPLADLDCVPTFLGEQAE